MKVVILAGGYGTRLSEETDLRPKPMVEIGGKPILWHIMKHYYSYGYDDFVILVGYKGFMIKEYFANYVRYNSDIVVDARNNEIKYMKSQSENWRIAVLDTGLDTMTGGRIKRAQDYLKDEPFLLTYGDGLADIDVRQLVDFHKQNNAICTMTAVQPEGRFGAIEFGPADQIARFREKPQGDGSWINGGFFVCDGKIFNYLGGDDCILERTPMEKLADEGQLYAYRHNGFWKCMDTLRDKNYLQELCQQGEVPWRI